MLNLLPNSLKPYLTCFIPALSVLAGFLVLVFLVIIMGELNFTKINFLPVSGFPNDMDDQEAFNITQAGAWWILAVYLFWLVAIIGSIVTTFIIFQFLKHLPTQTKNILKISMLSIMMVILLILIALVMDNTPLYSAQDVFKNFSLMLSGFTDHINLTNGLGILSMVLIVLSSGMILYPDIDDMPPSKRLKYLNALLLIGAVILLVWVFYARILYGLVAVTLIEEQSDYVGKLAPTISLIIGAVTSIYLILMYMSAFLWLQYKHASQTSNKSLTASIIEKGTSESPKRKLLAHWKQTIMLSGPMMPGLFEVLYQFFDKV